MSDAPDAQPPATGLREAEVVIVGGGPAGLAAALVLGRARRRVLVVDSGNPGHFAADGVHGFLGQEDVDPRELRRRVWEQLAPFDVELVQAQVVAGRQLHDAGDGSEAHTGTVFLLTLDDGSELRSQVVLLAGGIHYGVQPVDGLAELWGSKLFHCPFCEGWEVRDQRIAVVAPPTMVEHYEGFLQLWTDDVEIFGAWEQAAPTRELVEEAGVPPALIEADAARFAEQSGAVEVPVARSVRRDGEEVVVETDLGEHRFDVVFAPPVLAPVDDLPEQLGLTRYACSSVTTDAIGVEADLYGATCVPGLFAAGDLVSDTAAVAIAVAGGTRTAFAIARFIAARRWETTPH